MSWKAVCKLLQRRSADLLSQRNGFLFLLVGFVVITVTFMHFGETMMTWSADKYASVFNSFSDNIAGRSYQNRLCMPVPIDIVYTWVNGSDLRLVEDLRKYRRLMEVDLATVASADSNAGNEKSECTFMDCVSELSVAIDPALPGVLSMERISILYPLLRQAKALHTVVDRVKGHNVTLVMLDSELSVESILNSSIVIDGSEVRMKKVYITSDSTLINSVPSLDTVILTGFPHTMDNEKLLSELPEKYKSSVDNLRIFSDQGLALLNVKESKLYEELLKEDNITINSKALTFRRAHYVWDLIDYTANEDISASRFADNDELRYSLRSVERYAPWVRHIYIVTNGQIPAWLNLDNPRISVVSHSEIFLNKSHLPTFSSPSIEAHIHRIPGLSDRFIYMNDDVFFGRNVWPDDFLTSSGGQKVYLTWPVPNCRDGCPGSWIHDGYCDKACNNSDCEWDGGDCSGGSTDTQSAYQGALPHNIAGGGAGVQWAGRASDMYCSTGCADNWMADRYCDQSCNVAMCGFDAGDCGLESYDKLKGFTLSRDTSYFYGEGHGVIYFNYSLLVGENGSLTSGDYDNHDIIRSVAIAQKFKVITIVLKTNHSAAQLNFTLVGELDKAEKLSLNFTVRVDTTKVDTDTSNGIDTSESASLNTSLAAGEAVVEDLPVYKPHTGRKDPVVVKPLDKVPDEDIDLSEFNDTSLSIPDSLKKKYNELINEIETGELTEVGIRRASITLRKALDNLLTGNNSKQDQSKKKIGNKVDLQSNILYTSDNVKASNLKDSGVNQKFNNSARRNSVHRVLGNKLESRPKYKRPYVIASTVPQEIELQATNENNAPKRKLLSYSDDITALVETPSKDSHKHDVNSGYYVGFLPWERLGIFSSIMNRMYDMRQLREVLSLDGNRYKQSKADDHTVSDFGTLETFEHRLGRRLLDTFASSLHHVGRTYNRAYGYSARRVPAHMPHMIDRHVVENMQARFKEEWDETSSHRIRSGQDMQYAFSYYYFLMSEPRNFSIAEVFKELDVDQSGVLSDRELRTLATQLYELPLDLETLSNFEQMIINCSHKLDINSDNSSDTSEKLVVQSSNSEVLQTQKPLRLGRKDTIKKAEMYFDERMPQVTFELVEDCSPLVKLLEKQNSAKTQYEFQIVGEEDVAFKMIRNNVSSVIGQLDDVRRNRKKFICLNDNIDYTIDSAKVVKAVLHDLYESLLPIPSQFELSREYRNKFLHVDELRHWWSYRRQIKIIFQILLIILTVFAVVTLFCDRIDNLVRRRFLIRR